MNCQDKNSWFIFFLNKVLILEEEDKTNYTIPTTLPSFIEPSAHTTIQTFESIQGVTCKAIALQELPSAIDSQYLFVDLRTSYNMLPLAAYKAAGMASQLLFWDKNSQFCPACGTKTVQETAIMKNCPKCGKQQYPPINTAIIVLITRGDELLLVRAHNFRGEFHGLVAGFLEVGETLEECVNREVYEETNLKIKNIKYAGSQPWPYPSGMMVGFTAEYSSGDIKIQKEELKSAQFYPQNRLPTLPQKLSLARKIIDKWLSKN